MHLPYSETYLGIAAPTSCTIQHVEMIALGGSLSILTFNGCLRRAIVEPSVIASGSRKQSSCCSPCSSRGLPDAFKLSALRLELAIYCSVTLLAEYVQ